VSNAERERLILWERPDGIPWLVAHWAAKRSVAVTPAPPEWASPELTEAVEGALCASVEGFCGRCEAVRPARARRRSWRPRPAGRHERGPGPARRMVREVRGHHCPPG